MGSQLAGLPKMGNRSSPTIKPPIFGIEGGRFDFQGLSRDGAELAD